MLKSTRAFSPAGISSFFEICDQTSEGTPITDPRRVGARGGGFAINKGVLTKISLTEANVGQTRVFINGQFRPDATTTLAVATQLLEMVSGSFNITVRHRVEVPEGAGFGTSGAGALGTALALGKALGLNLTYNQLGRIAHIAEVRCLTGLGTVGPLMLGGCIVTVEPGAPGYAIIDRIPVSPVHRIVAGAFSPYPTRDVLSSQDKKGIINKEGRKTLRRILATPSLENFMEACKGFAMATGFLTPRVRKLITLAETAGAVGAAQNMVGEAVHALVTEDKVDDVVQAFQQVMPRESIITGKIDLQGARLLR